VALPYRRDTPGHPRRRHHNHHHDVSDDHHHSVPDTTTTSAAEGSHVVETVEEAEEILRELWFGWFEGIYHQDEDRIREVVGNPEQIQNAVDQFGVMEFEHMPTLSGISLDETEILRSDSECLALWSEVEADFRDGSLEGFMSFDPIHRIGCSSIRGH
jgi:predicted RNase H-like HicB family nuclease